MQGGRPWGSHGRHGEAVYHADQSYLTSACICNVLVAHHDDSKLHAHHATLAQDRQLCQLLNLNYLCSCTCPSSALGSYVKDGAMLCLFAGNLRRHGSDTVPLCPAVVGPDAESWHINYSRGMHAK